MKSTLSFRFAVCAAAATLMLGNTLVSMQIRAMTPAAKAAVQVFAPAEAK
jgi:hypothetical protein